MRRWILSLAALTAACKTSPPPAPPAPPARSSAELYAEGRTLFNGDTLIGEGGKSCAGCHERDQPLEAYRLARQLYDLPSLIARCLLTRTKHPDAGDAAAWNVQALQAYVIHRFVHDGDVHDENDEGIRRLGEAMWLLLEGRYEDAMAEARGAHRLIRTQHYHVRALMLEGCIHVFLLQTEEAKRVFAEALQIDPAAAIDHNVFSPKVGAVLEETRATLAANSSVSASLDR
jgi:tetratricopeptide (TPR) repeat protein